MPLPLFCGRGQHDSQSFNCLPQQYEAYQRVKSDLKEVKNALKGSRQILGRNSKRDQGTLNGQRDHHPNEPNY